MIQNKARDRKAQDKQKASSKVFTEDEQAIIEALEYYLSRRSSTQPHPLLQWVMW